MRGGVREQNKVLQQIRKAARAEANMKDVTGFSLLSAKPPKLTGKRSRADFANDV